jgi:DNA-binding transcriptional MerR regulator
MSGPRLPLLAKPDAVPPSGDARDGESREPVDEADLAQVGDLARRTGKTVRAIHLYEELGLLRPAARSKGGFRLYAPDAELRIRWINKLQEMGFSLGEIQSVLRDWERAHSAPRAMVRMREVYRRKLEETRAHVERLRALESDLAASLSYLESCEVCDPERLLSACSRCEHHGKEEGVPELVAGFRATRAGVPAPPSNDP